MKTSTSPTTNVAKRLTASVALLTTLAFATNSSGVPTLKPAGDTHAAVFQWQECLITLGLEHRLEDKAIIKLIEVFERSSYVKNPDFIILAVALTAVESGFNSRATSSSGAVGLMQVTSIGAKEAEQHCPAFLAPGKGERLLALNTRLLDPDTNVKYGTCLLHHYLQEVNYFVTLGLVLYNGGYKQLTRLSDSGTLAKETQSHILRVNQNIRRCQ